MDQMAFSMSVVIRSQNLFPQKNEDQAAYHSSNITFQEIGCHLQLLEELP
jgi:hypothetical protein